MLTTKFEVAKIQLETALEIYFEKSDDFSVITLAGASEEIFGNLLKRTGKKSMVDQLVALDKKLTRTGRGWKIINEEINGIRNKLKHANNPSEDTIEFHPEHSTAMLARALANFSALDNNISPIMLKFYEHLQQLHPDVTPTEQGD